MMDREEAKYILNNYPCVCKYGSSPTNCSAALDRCEFKEAVKVLAGDKVNLVRAVWGTCAVCGCKLKKKDTSLIICNKCRQISNSEAENDT